MAKQVIFRDLDGAIHSGIKIDTNSIICGCCGQELRPGFCKILHTYDYWVELESQITGDDSLEIFTQNNLTDEEIENYFKENN